MGAKEVEAREEERSTPTPISGGNFQQLHSVNDSSDINKINENIRIGTYMKRRRSKRTNRKKKTEDEGKKYQQQKLMPFELDNNNNNTKNKRSTHRARIFMLVYIYAFALKSPNDSLRAGRFISSLSRVSHTTQCTRHSAHSTIQHSSAQHT